MHYFVKPRGGCIILLSLGEGALRVKPRGGLLSCFNKPREVFLTMTLLVSLGEREEEWWAHKPGRFDNDCVDKPRGG